MWVNLVAMCVFLVHAASGVVLAILDVLGIYPKAAQANGETESEQEAWAEGSDVLAEFQATRPVRHWQNGYGFAIAVDAAQEKPYLVCFASGLAERYVLQPGVPWHPRFAASLPSRGLRFWLCRYNAKELATYLTVQAIETRAWTLPSVSKLPLAITGAHVFHVWLGLGRVLEISEVHGLRGLLTDRMTHIHVRRIPAATRMRC